MPARVFVRALALLAVLLTHAAEPADARRVALAIGNGAYSDSNALTNTINDAQDMAALLTRLGFEVLEGTNLDKRGMERLIRQFDQKLSDADIALFYYAGHGMQVAGQNYLVPIDAKLISEGDIDFEALPLGLVLSRMERRAKTSLVLLDACRDNPLARNLARSSTVRSGSIGQGLAEIRTGVGTLISFSTQPGNVAIDGAGRNSPYTAALLRQIEVAGRDVVSALATVRSDVVRATNGKQVPWEHTSLMGPVVLMPATVAPPVATLPPTPPVLPPGRLTEAAEAWNSIKDTSNKRILESFAARFRETFFADLARERIAELDARDVGTTAHKNVPDTGIKRDAYPDCYALQTSSECQENQTCRWSIGAQSLLLKEGSSEPGGWCRPL